MKIQTPRSVWNPEVVNLSSLKKGMCFVLRKQVKEGAEPVYLMTTRSYQTVVAVELNTGDTHQFFSQTLVIPADVSADVKVKSNRGTI